MKIILEKNYGKGTKIFDNKSDMLDYILNYNNREYQKLNDDFDDHCSFNRLPKNIKKWNIYELVNYLFSDYKRVKNEN